MKSKRNIKSIRVNIHDNDSKEIIEKIPNLKDIIFKETFIAIQEGINMNKEIVSLFEINNSGFILDLEKKYWVSSLEKAILFYEEKEAYEKCALFKNLISQINEFRETKQNNRRRKPYAKRKNTDQAKEKNSSNTK